MFLYWRLYEYRGGGGGGLVTNNTVKWVASFQIFDLHYALYFASPKKIQDGINKIKTKERTEKNCTGQNRVG